jgi:hypothetical protein
VDVPVNWTGPSGHVLQEPWMQDFFRGDLAALISDLEGSCVPGLDGKRTTFRTGCLIDRGSRKSQQLPRVVRQEQAVNALLNQRAELLVGAQLAKAGVLTRMRADTPDFEGRWGSEEFGVEVTTRARPEVSKALHQVLEQGLWEGPDVLVTLVRTGPLFSEEPDTIAKVGARVIADITQRVADAGGEPGSAVIPVPDLELSAEVVWPSPVPTMPGIRVNYQPVVGEQWTDNHWEMAALMIKDRIDKDKALKTYSLPSILVLDVSRLGNAGQMPTGIRNLAELFTGGTKPPWPTEFQAVLDGCELGNLNGVLVVRSHLGARTIEPLCWRLDGSPAVTAAAAAVCLGDQMPAAPSPEQTNVDK